MEQKSITLEKIDVLIEKLRTKPTINSIFYFTKVLKKCLGGADTNQEQLDLEQEFIIEESEAFDKIIQFGLTHFPQILKKIYLQSQEKLKNDLKDQTDFNPNILKYVKSKKMEIILKVFLFNLYKFFEQLHEDDMILFVLKQLPEISDLIYVFPHLERRLLKTLIDLWAGSEVLAIKLHAFIVIRRIILNKKKTEREASFRNELLSIDLDAAYLVAFSYLRQIAMNLKEGMLNKKPESEKKLYNWEIINSLKVWVNVICKHDELSQLIYPMAEIIQGLISYHKEVQYIPIHLHFMRMLIDIQDKTGLFIPIIQNIKEFLQQNVYQKKLEKKSGLKTFDFVLNIKVEKKYRKSSIFWNDVFKQLLDLSLISLARFAGHPEAPEITFNFVKFLTRLGKSLKFVVYKMQIKELINKIKQNNEQIINLRIKSGLAPKDKKARNTLIGKGEKSSLEKEAQKVIEERETKIKQRILSEKDYFENKNNRRRGQQEDDDEEDDEDISEQEEQDDEDQSYDFEQDISKENSEGEEEEKAEGEEDYDLEEMDYEGDPENYVSDDDDEDEQFMDAEE